MAKRIPGARSSVPVPSVRGLFGDARALARREQNRLNKQAQRARDAAGIAAKRPGPPRVTGNAAERAAAAADAQNRRREEFARNLPDVRNPQSKIWVAPARPTRVDERKTPAGQKKLAGEIREKAAADRLQAFGAAKNREVKAELRSGPASARLQQVMDPEQQSRFQAYADRISGQTQQSTAILFRFAGGGNDYKGALEKILGSPEGTEIETGLEMLENLARQAESANAMYAPRAIGRVRL